jgi:hypothetical protein
MLPRDRSNKATVASKTAKNGRLPRDRSNKATVARVASKTANNTRHDVHDSAAVNG